MAALLRPTRAALHGIEAPSSIQPKKHSRPSSSRSASRRGFPKALKGLATHSRRHARWVRWPSDAQLADHALHTTSPTNEGRPQGPRVGEALSLEKPGLLLRCRPALIVDTKQDRRNQLRRSIRPGRSTVRREGTNDESAWPTAKRRRNSALSAAS